MRIIMKINEKDFMAKRRRKELPRKIGRIILFIFLVAIGGIAIFKFNPAQYFSKGFNSHISLEGTINEK